MITTAVHQASQMVEIQGAPAAAPASGDDFRATFAASVGGSVPQKQAQSSTQAAGGAASSRQGIAAGLVLKTPSAASNALQDALKLNAAGPDEGAAETGSAARVKASNDLALKNDAAADAGIKTADAAADTSADLAKRLGDEAQVKISELGAANLPAPASAVAATKDVRTAKSPDAAAVRVRKEESSPSSSKDAISVSTRGTGVASLAPGSTPISGAPLTNAVAVFAQVSQVAENWTNNSALGSALRTGEDVKSASGGSVIGAGKEDPASTAPGPDELASLQPGISPALFAAEVSRTTGSTGNTATAGNFNGGVAESGPKVAPQSDLLAAAVQPGAGDSAAARSVRGHGALAADPPLAVESNSKPFTRSAPTKSISAGNVADVKAGTSATGAAAVTPKATTLLRPAPNAQPQIASRAALSKTAGAAATQPAGADAEASASAVAAGSVEASTATSAPAASGHDGIKLAQQQVDTASDAPAVAVPVAEASSRAANTATEAAKDEKTKSIAASSDDSTSVRPAAQTISGVTSNGGSNLAAAGNNLPGRTAPLADGAVPLAVANIAASSSHTAAASGPTGSLRASVAASAASAAEPSSSIAQTGEAHRTLLATPTTLEVGVQSGTQGWLRIRAEVGGPGEVNALLSAASSGGRDMLHSQMPALNAFLHSEQLSVTATVADRGPLGAGTGSGSGGLGTALGSDASGGSNASLLQGGGAQSGGSQRETTQPVADVSASEQVNSYDARVGGSDAAGALSGGIAVSDASGRWLNVRV